MKKTAGLSPEVFAGLVLAGAALLGVIAENIGLLRPLYDEFLNTHLTLAVGEASIDKPLLLWINDGLMAIFFLLVALEIKREAMEGTLSEWKRAALPFYGAIGGIAVPALVFVGIVGIEAAEAKGWAIPAATDIAFALGVLSLFGSRVPSSLKTFLLTLAVIDDLAAIMIIAVFYTANLSVAALAVAGAAIAILVGLNLVGVKRLGIYLVFGLVLWVAVLKSGVHATLAGVALGFAIPLRPDREGRSLLLTMEHAIHPYVALMILPLFAFANAGVPLGGLSAEDLTHPLVLGIAAGLFLGKQFGIFAFAYAAVKLKLAAPPAGANFAQLYGVGLLAGIGFTMSLFIGTLAFSEPEMQNLVRLGVLSGSILSGLLGAAVLAATLGRKPATMAATEQTATS